MFPASLSLLLARLHIKKKWALQIKRVTKLFPFLRVIIPHFCCWKAAFCPASSIHPLSLSLFSLLHSSSTQRYPKYLYDLLLLHVINPPSIALFIRVCVSEPPYKKRTVTSRFLLIFSLPCLKSWNFFIYLLKAAFCTTVPYSSSLFLPLPLYDPCVLTPAVPKYFYRFYSSPLKVNLLSSVYFAESLPPCVCAPTLILLPISLFFSPPPSPIPTLSLSEGVFYPFETFAT